MWYNDYVGIPFLQKGREKTGVDCWGLVRLVYKEEFDIDLPSFADDYEYEDTERIEQLTAQYKEGWEETTTPKPGSVILFKVLGHLSHIGIYIGGNKFLHCLENHSSVIENLESINWNKRFAGFFNYVEKSSAVLNAVPHPLRTERWTVPVRPGTTIEQLSHWVLEKFEISGEISSQVTIIRNGVVVSKDAYSTTIILDKDTIEYRAVPGKSLIRIALIIAVAYIAYASGQYYLAGAVAPGAAATAGQLGTAALISASVSTIGNLLIGYLMPIRPPSQPKDPGSSESQLLLSGGSNQVSKYAAIPVVLGKVRMTPLLGGENYVDSNTDNSYLNMLLVWGFGPLKLDKSTLRIGLNPFSQYQNGAGIPIEHYHLNDTQTADDANDIINFNAIYGSDRQQVYVGTTLVMQTTPTNVNVDEGDGQGAVGPFIGASLGQSNTVRIDVNLHFPQGLRQLRVKGKHSGDIYELGAKFQVQVAAFTVGGVAIGGWGSGTNATIPATTVIADATYNTAGTAKYRWTRIGIGSTGIQVKVGPRCDAINSAYGIGGSFDLSQISIYLAAMSGNTTTNTSAGDAGVRLPAWPADVTPLYDICMYGPNIAGSTDYGTSLRDRRTITGMTVTTGEIASVNYSTASWANPTAGANTGDKLVNIAQGTIYRATNAIITLGTSASGKFVKRKDAFSYTVSMPVAKLPDDGFYRVRVRRLTDDNEDDKPDPDNKLMHVIVFQSATATATNKPIVEGTNWRLTKSAIRIKANDQLNSRIEGVNGIVTTICKDWNSTTSKWAINDQGSNNPASLFLYILEHPANAYRVEPADLNAKINMDALGAWWTFCNSRGFTFNSVVSSQVSVLDILKDIAAAGRASPAMVDGRWTVVIDTDKPDIIQHFTPHNSWGFESSKRLPRQPHALRVSYLNEQADYQEEESIIYNQGYAATASGTDKAAEIFEQINLPGITSEKNIKAHARWHLAQAALRPEIYTINTDLEYLVCNRGDRVKVVHDVPLWGIGSGRIGDRIVTSTPTSISSTLISGSSYDVTAQVVNQIYPIYNVGDTITVSGSPIVGYNGTKTVTGCTATTVRWTDTSVTGTATISNTATLNTTGITVNTGTDIATATFVNQGYIPFAVGSRIYIAGAIPATYNGTRLVTACTASEVQWADDVTTITATTQGTVKGTIVPSIVGTECSVFKLDEDVPLEATKVYTVRVRSKTGGSYLWNVAAVSVDGYYNTIKISRLATDGVSTPIADKIDVNDLFLFALQTYEAQDLLVLAIEPFGNQNAKITLVDYAEKLFLGVAGGGVDFTNAFKTPAYTSKITLPPKNLVQTIIYKPIVTSIISDETVMEQISAGNFKINIKIGFTNPPQLPTDIEYVQAEIDDLGDSLDNWHTSVAVLANKQTITITGVDELNTYRIRLRYQSKDGRNGPWTTAALSPVSSTAWSSGTLTINTVSRHSFSVGAQVYLYNAQGTSLNNIYTVDAIPSKTSLSCAITKPTISITTAATTARAGYATAAYTDRNYTPYIVGSQIIVAGAVPATYNGVSNVTACDSAGVSWSTGNLLTYTENMTTWSQAVDADTTVTYETAVANSQGVNGVSKIQLATTASAQRQISQASTLLAANTVITISVDAKAAELSTLRLYLGTKIPDYPSVTFDLATGTISTVTNAAGTSVLNYGMINLSTGWYRCWLSASVGSGAGTPAIIIQIPNTAGTVGQGFYVSRAQMNLGEYPGQYIPVLAATANVLPITATTQGTITPCVITTSITQTGGVATATFDAQKHLSLAPGSSITISGATPAGFNGTFVITSSTATTITWASAITGPATRQGTIVRTTGVGSWVTSTANQANQDLVTGQGLVSAYNNLENAFIPDKLIHQVIGKTSPPSTVTNFTAVPLYGQGILSLNWTANSEIDVQYYEVRTDTLWGSETNRVFYGAGVSCTAVPAALGVAKTYYIKAIDYSLNYGLTSATFTYTVVVPPTITASPIATFLYNTTSLSDTNVIFNWAMPASSNFLIDRYELTLVKPGVDTLVQEVTGTTWTTPANWVGVATLTIKTIDILGNKSVASASLAVTKNLPASVSGASITTTPVGTGLAIYWAEVAPLSTGMAVAGYEIRTTDSNWGTALGTMLYSGSANSTTVDIKGTTSGTTLTYYIKAYDADNRYSSAATSFTYLVAAPVDTSWSNVPFVFGENSLTAATITLTWNPASPVFGLYGYELSYTTTGGVLTTRILNTTSIVLNASTVWNVVGTGTVTFTVKVIDNLNVNNKSVGATIAQTTVTKSAPSPVSNYTSKVIDNNVLLSWTPPAKTSLPIDHITVYKGDTYATAANIGDKTGTFTTVFEQTGGTFTYWVVVVDTDNQVSTPVSLTALVASPPDYVFNAAYSSIFANVSTTVTNTTNLSANVTVGSTEGMYAGMQIILSGTAFGGLTAGYWYVVSILDSTTINISSSSALTPIFTGTSTASGTMTLTDATGAEGINSNTLYDNQGIVMPVDTTATFTKHFDSGTGRTWTGPSDQNVYFPIFIQPGKSSGYYEEVYNYTKPLASSQITMSYTGTAFNAPAITPMIGTAASVAGTTLAGGTGSAVTVTNAANSTTLTSSEASVGLVIGNFITVPAGTGQTVRVISVVGNLVTVTPAIVAANTTASWSYAGAFTNYTGTTALGTAFQYVKAKIHVAQATRSAGAGTGISAPGAVGPSLDLNFVSSDTLDPRITFTRNSIGTHFDSTGIMRAVTANVPRFDYDPVTLAPKGLLIEEARTNLVFQSAAIGVTSWSAIGITATANSIVAPDGTLNGTKLVSIAADSVAGATNMTATATTTYTASVYLKADVATTVSIFIVDATGGSGNTQTVCNVTTSWQRFTVTRTTSALTTAINMQIGGANTFSTGETVYAWGAQVELGAFATSYIPTVATTVLRAAELAVMTGTNFSSWYNATEGTFAVQSGYTLNAANGPSGDYYFSASDNTTANFILLADVTGTKGQVTATSTNTYNSTVGTRATSTTTKVHTLAYKLNDTNQSSGGTTGTTDITVTIPTVSRLNIGINYTGSTGYLNAYIQRLTYFPRRVIDADLTLLSNTGQVTVTGVGSAFTKTFKAGDTITIPNTAVGVDYNVTSVTSDTLLGVMVPVGLTMPVHSAGTSYAFKGTDLYKLQSLGVKLDAKQKSESGMVVVTSTDSGGSIVNFSSTFIDVASINLASQGTTAVTCVYNFLDTNPTGTYTVSGTTTCTVNITAHGLVSNTINQLAYLTFTSGTAPSGRYPVTYVNANQFTITLPAALTTSGSVSMYPNSMTVYAFNDAGTRISIPSPGVSWTVRGF